MPTPIVDLHRAGDPRDVVHEAVRRLAQGELVGLPTETSYVAVALATSSESVARLRTRSPSDRPSTLALPAASAAWDYVSDLSRTAARLIDRCWPGPIVLQFASGLSESLARALDPQTLQRIAPQEELRLRVPGDATFCGVLRLLPAPLVMSAETDRPSVAVTAQDLLDQYGDALSLIVDNGSARYGQRATTVRIAGERWECVEPGIVNDRTVARLASEVFVFICTGNTCRSPMAEALFRKMLTDRLQCAEDDLVVRGYTVLSAGLSAGSGMPAAPDALELLRREGIDLSGHASQSVTDQMLLRADHILAMTAGHLDAILESYPELAGRARMLSPEGDDIMDPIGAGPEEYRRCRDQIVGYLHGLISEIPSE